VAVQHALRAEFALAAAIVSGVAKMPSNESASESSTATISVAALTSFCPVAAR
jgi:hypothetical protein